MLKKTEIKCEIPDFLIDPKTRREYKKGRFLGRGGFAKCWELIDMSKNESVAAKIIPKAQLTKSEHREKMSQEISIHQSLKHRHIVEFKSFFEDSTNIYILLEICSKRSLMEMHKRRKTLTEPEVRYFVRQIALACKFIHDSKVVHRDLKLGNVFLNDDMHVKVGDFGLATRVGNGERKLTLCGTPNYIAPEVLTKKGHSFEVDVWSLGCIAYTLLVGKPPFETNDLKETYRKIRHNDYTVPSHVPHDAKVFIDKLLQADPSKRPNMDQILDDPYMTRNYVPSRLPNSCLTTHPRFDQGRLSVMPNEIMVASPRRVTNSVQSNNNRVAIAGSSKPEPLKPEPKPSDMVPFGHEGDHRAHAGTAGGVPSSIPIRSDLENQDMKVLHDQLVALLQHTRKVSQMSDDALDPSCVPVYWLSKWVDYTEKYGLGYQLSDNSIGVLFNDYSRILMMADEASLQYIEKNGDEHFLHMNEVNQFAHQFSQLTKKVTLLNYFKNYMNEHLLKTGEKIPEADEMTRLPYLYQWFRTRTAIVFQLTNGTVQINFFGDHIKLILCPKMEAVTVVSEQREFFTYKFDLLQRHGCTHDLLARLRFAYDVVRKLIMSKPQMIK